MTESRCGTYAASMPDEDHHPVRFGSFYGEVLYVSLPRLTLRGGARGTAYGRNA
ncbi:hypothetical protein ACFVHW_31110 [Streptomyces sp. NPDC127110]|uniref:hypothetical protein n=1 Tax=Streptomyces sp. NPDC127110 TaxID=3345362 RepID=UPI00363D3BD4